MVRPIMFGTMHTLYRNDNLYVDNLLDNDNLFPMAEDGLGDVNEEDDPELSAAELAVRSALTPWIVMRSSSGLDHVDHGDGDDLTELNRAITQSFSESAAVFGSVPAAKAVVERLEKFTYKRSIDESEWMTCVICMEEVMTGSHLTRLPCSHRFHGDCISQWLLGNHTCPICRFKLPTQ